VSSPSAQQSSRLGSAAPLTFVGNTVPRRPRCIDQANWLNRACRYGTLPVLKKQRLFVCRVQSIGGGSLWQAYEYASASDSKTDSNAVVDPTVLKGH
jgi:hypothetical protein